MTRRYRLGQESLQLTRLEFRINLDYLSDVIMEYHFIEMFKAKIRFQFSPADEHC
jgi:hypothetical protein